MRMKFFYLLLFVILLFSYAAVAQDCKESKDLPNFGCVNDRIYRGAQPTEKGVKELAARGVKTIIYLRDADDNAQIEEMQAKNAGVKFINVPMGNWLKPKDSKIEEILNLLKTSENQPVFIHCKRGADRTGTVIAAYRISHDGWTAKQAKAEAKSYHFGWWQFWMNDYIDDYYKNHQKQKS